LGFANRLSTFVRQKTYYLIDKFENPVENLDYSFEKHKESITSLRRDIAEVISAKRHLQIQRDKLLDTAQVLDHQALLAIEYDKEILARDILERKNVNLMQLEKLDKQIASLDVEKDKLQQLEKNLTAKVEEIKARIEIIKAQYSAAESEVRIKESITGVLNEVLDLGVALKKAEDKLEKLRAKSQALDQMIESGMLVDYTSNEDKVEKQLQNIELEKSVDDELARLKSKLKAKKRKRMLEKKKDDDDELKQEQDLEGYIRG
jgi:phage shock protein A